MEIFGSYMGRDNSLAGEGVRICALDNIVAIMAGLIIFPACFSYGVEVPTKTHFHHASIFTNTFGSVMKMSFGPAPTSTP